MSYEFIKRQFQALISPDCVYQAMNRPSYQQVLIGVFSRLFKSSQYFF